MLWYILEWEGQLCTVQRGTSGARGRRLPRNVPLHDSEIIRGAGWATRSII